MTKQKFANQWLRHFAPELSKADFQKYVKDQHIWHVFSWKLIPLDNLLTGDAARQAFNAVNKADCLCCDAFGSEGVTDILSPHYDTAEKIDAAMTEFYIVDKDYTWTYIKTHECDFCGPYFFKKDT